MENKTRNIIDSVESLEKALKKLRAAQEEFATYSQEQVDKIFFAAATGLVETGRYCARLVIALLTDVSYSLSPLLLLLVYVLCFIGMSFLFIGQRSEA